MASLRELPSGRWQASVLLDDGKRTTKTFDTAHEAQEWAVEREAERDKLRAERQSDASDHVVVLMSALRSAAHLGLLKEEHRRELREIADVR